MLQGAGLLVGAAASAAEADASANARRKRGVVGAGAWRVARGGQYSLACPTVTNLPFPEGSASASHPPYDRSPRRALDKMPAEARAAWRNRYAPETEAELRVQAPLDRAEAALRLGGAPVTIRTLWMALADRAGRSDDADLHAAVALAGMALGLRPS